MVHKMVVSLARQPVTVCDSQFSSFEFIQDVARAKNADLDSFFVADLGKVRLLVDQWTSNLPRVRPYYAVNCNSDEPFLRILSSFPQIGFHCTTRQNVDVALDFVGSDRLFYSNPCWTRGALANAQSHDVSLLGFDSEHDLTRMANCGIKNRLILNISLNNQSAEQSAIGCDVSQAPQLLQLAADFGLECVGVGFNLGGQRPALFDSLIECASQLFAIGRSLGLAMNVLSLGGGFPSLFSPHMPSFEMICEQINISLDYYFPASEFGDIEIIATPGRFFATPVFSLATKIVGRVEVDASDITKDGFDCGQKAFIYKINEGYFGAFGCRIMPNCEPKCLPLFSELPNTPHGEMFFGSVLGPHMDDEELDVVQSKCQFRQMSVDEWLLWPNMGAYCMNNTCSLDDDDEDQCNSTAVYYFSKENDWKYIGPKQQQQFDNPMTFLDAEEEVQSDGESFLSEDSAIDAESIEDLLWIFDWPIV